MRTNVSSGGAGAESRTKTFSMRLTEAEHARVREIAKRLGATEASVMRYAVRSMTNRLAPLHEPNASGCSLIPVFVEFGSELSSYFDLDVTRLERILNGESEPPSPKVEQEDLMLLSMSGLSEPKVHAKLRELTKTSVGHGDVPQSLRSYFYEKYIYKESEEQSEKS